MNADKCTFHTSKVLWIENGILQDPIISIIESDDERLLLHIKMKNWPVCICRLSSPDGFNYTSTENANEYQYFLNLKLFRQEVDIILYGNWIRGTDEGDVCIHALEYSNRSDQDFFPPAA